MPPDLISFAEYLNNNYKQLTYNEYQKIEQKDKTLEELNNDIEFKRLKEICEITEVNNPGAKFRRMFEDMKKKLTLDAKIKRDFFPESKVIIEENKDKDNAEDSIKRIYDKGLYSKWEVNDIGEGTSKEVPLKRHVGLLPKNYDKYLKKLNREAEEDIEEFQERHKKRDDDLSV